MYKGNMDRCLHLEVRKDEPQRLTLLQRLNISIDIASALECEVLVVHNDLKPNNVLLDDDMTSHISDFGISKITMIATSFGADQNNSNTMKGSIGYIAQGINFNYK